MVIRQNKKNVSPDPQIQNGAGRQVKALVQQLDTHCNPDEKRKMFSMQGCLLLLVLAISPLAPQQQTKTAEQRIVALAEWLGEWKTQSPDAQDLIEGNQLILATELDNLVAGDVAVLVKAVQVTQNVTNQLLVELQVLKGRQAVAGAIQGAQVCIFLAYLGTIFVFYLVKHCKKHHKKAAREEFELLESKLQASRSKRRAAAARTGKQSPQ